MILDCDGLRVYVENPIEPQRIFGFDPAHSCTFSADSASFNVDLLNKLVEPVGDFSIMLYIPEVVQVRKHRKKRINKKWAKKYGYKTVLRKRPFTAPLEPDWFMPMI